MANKPVMVVEDELDIRENMQMLLEDEGYTVYCANNGQQALDILRDENREMPGLVALDFYMPIMDGRQFLHAVEENEGEKAALQKLSVVLVTASDARSRADLVGKTVDVLKKPVNVDKFLALVAQYCGSPA